MRFKASFGIVVIALFVFASPAMAERWPSLDDYVSDCVLIVKGRATDDPASDGMRSFEVLETWKGRYDPSDFSDGMAEGNTIRAREGEHGVKVVRGQEIILFYTRHNQPDDKLDRHSTAFPIVKERIVYASTNDSLHEEMSVEDFQKRVAAASAAAGDSSAKDEQE